MNNDRRLITIVTLFGTIIVLTICCVGMILVGPQAWNYVSQVNLLEKETPKPVVIVETVEIIVTQTPMPTAVVTETPTQEPTIIPTQQVEYFTPCGNWDTTPGATNWLLPNTVARGDIEVDGIKYYDIGGTGEGTSVINLSSKPIEIFSEWGSGCEVSTDLKFLVNKDLSDGCGDFCTVARIVTITDEGVEEEFYSEPLE